MRSYIRHPADIPVQVDTTPGHLKGGQSRLANVSQGGLAFDAAESIPVGSMVRLLITVVDPGFEAEGVVTHCRQEAGHYVIGIEFIHRDDLYVARMVEQVCHIEHYKRAVAEREGRILSGEEAAREWIEKYAEHFPRWDI